MNTTMAAIATQDSCIMAGPTTFPKFRELPHELRIWIWEEFIRDESASRIVLMESEMVVGQTAARIMPLKRLISPLLLVCYESRYEALRHYNTRIDIKDLPPPTGFGVLEIEVPDEMGMLPDTMTEDQNTYFYSADRPHHTPEMLRTTRRSQTQERFSFPSDDEAQHPERQWADEVESLVVINAMEHIDYESHHKAAHPNYFQPRGCVYLDLETDRFLLLNNWRSIPGLYFEKRYGYRALSNALSDFIYHRVPVDLEGLLGDKRPAALRNISVPLPLEVRQRIRHAVVPHHKKDYATRLGQEDWFEQRSFLPGQINCLGRPEFARDHFPRAAYGDDGTMGAFWTTEATFHCFFDDMEDKGPEHLGIRPARMFTRVLDEETGFSVHGLEWGEEGDGTEEDETEKEEVRTPAWLGNIVL
ncbi:hypothetical protein PG995_002839 [Apiospora arundinis]